VNRSVIFFSVVYIVGVVYTASRRVKLHPPPDFPGARDSRRDFAAGRYSVPGDVLTVQRREQERIESGILLVTLPLSG